LFFGIDDAIFWGAVIIAGGETGYIGHVFGQLLHNGGDMGAVNQGAALDWGLGSAEFMSLAAPIMKPVSMLSNAAKVCEANSLMDQLVLGAAKEGKGIKIIDSLGDPRFRGMEKWSYGETSDAGIRSEVHYVVDPKTGARMDFKFKISYPNPK
jgi:hypothetical protein